MAAVRGAGRPADHRPGLGLSGTGRQARARQARRQARGALRHPRGHRVDRPPPAGGGVGRRPGRQLLPAGAGLGPRAADRRPRQRQDHPGGLRRPQRPALRVHRPLAGGPRRAVGRPGLDAEHPRVGAAQSQARARDAQRQPGRGVLPRRAGDRSRARPQGRLWRQPGPAAGDRGGCRFRAAGHAGVPGHHLPGLRPAVATPGVRPGHRHRHPRRGARRLLLGLRRRGRPAGRAHEATRPDVAAVAEAGREPSAR